MNSIRQQETIINVADDGFKKEGGVHLSWNDISYGICNPGGEDDNSKTKSILDQVSGYIEPGEMVGILGASGAGKSTLLNILAGRLGASPAGTITGQILVNGHERTKNFRRLFGYVEQDDVMYRTLTVYETIEFSSLLRLPKNMSASAKYARVEEIIKRLGLAHCVDTLVGDDSVRGISGGERKRLAIGVELVSNPKLLFLDEPTTGLDAFTAFQTIELIRKLVHETGKSVLCTIHQPRANILKLFDKILLLSRGRVVYFGSVSGALEHFSSFGHDCPSMENPADFFLDNLVLDNRSDAALVESKKRISILEDGWKNQQQKIRSVETSFSKSVLHEGTINPGWFAQFLVLLRRNFLVARRDRMFTVAMLTQAVVLALLLGFTLFQVGLEQPGIIARQGILFFMCVNTCFSVIQPIVMVFPLEKQIIIRERFAMSYKVSAALFSKFLVLWPLRIVMSQLLFSGIYLLCGLQRGVWIYFQMSLVIQCLSIAAISLGLMIGAISPSLPLSQVITPLVMVVFMVYGGNMSPAILIPRALSWLQYISPIKYAYMAVCNLEFTGLLFKQMITSSGPAGFATGEQFLSAMDLLGMSVTECCVHMLNLSICFMLVAYFGLRITTHPSQTHIHPTLPNSQSKTDIINE